MLGTSRLGGFWNEGAARLLIETLENRGKKVEELAADIGVDPRTVRYWISEPPTRPSVANLRKLCKAVGLTEDDFRRAAAAYVSSAEPIGKSGASDPSEDNAQRERSDSRHRWLTLLRSHRMAATVGAALILAATIALIVVARRTGKREPPRSSSYSIPSFDENYEEAWAGRISPDGRYIAFNAVNLEAVRKDEQKQPPRQLFILSTEEGARAVPIRGTEGIYTTFFWDYAGKGLYVIRDKKLVYVAVNGTPEKGNTDVEGGTHGDANSSGFVVLGSRRGLIFVPPNGTAQVRDSSSAQLFPRFLPDGDRFLYIEQRRDENGNATRDLYLMSLTKRVPKLIERSVPSRVEYSRGYLLYVRNCVLLARRFDLDSERLDPDEHRVKDDVWMEDLSGSASFSTSADGVLVTQAPPTISAVQRIHLTPRGLDQDALPIDQVHSIAIGAQRDELLIARGDRCRQTRTLWRWPLTGEAPQCLTCGRGSSTSPLLSRDGETVYFGATRGNVTGIYSIVLNTPTQETLLFSSPDFPGPRDVLPDGKGLIIQMTKSRDGNLFTIPADGSSVATPIVTTPEMEGESARVSLDGQWLAFSASRESESGIFIVRFGRPPNEARLAGPRGWRCRWSDDGKKLYYARRHAVMEYDLERSSTRTLFELDSDVTEIAVAGDDTFYVVTTRESHNRIDGDWTRALSKSH